MLKELIAVWKGENFMNRVIKEFEQMLIDAEYVFTKAWLACEGKLDINEHKQQLYDKDRSVNNHERGIRRKLAEHLSLNPRQDVAGCLAIMSLVKDAERIGDYSKNIFDLTLLYEDKINQLKYLKELANIHEQLSVSLPKLRKAFLGSDDITAKEILKHYAPIKDACNKILNDLFSENLSSKEAVATALLSRYLKRINSHLSNIASGIVYPLDQIDFVRGDLLE